MSVPPVLWQPSERAIEEAQVTQFARQVIRKHRLEANSYPDFHQWTVDNPEIFWNEVWEGCGVIASRKGATVLVGGHRRGPCFEPTVLTGVTPQMRCYHEETFGPVVALTPVKNADEAVRLANDTSYGLSAAIITGDPERGMALAERIDSGIVHVNDSTVHDEPHAPFGGIKGSGLGRHGGRAAIEAFTEIRWVSLQTERRHYPFDP